MTGYRDSREHLFDELRRIDLLLNAQVARQRRAPAFAGFNEFRGLFISETEIDAALNGGQSAPAGPREDDAEVAALQLAVARLEAEIAARLAARAPNAGLALPRLADMFQLSQFDVDTLLVCLAPELDLKYEKLYSYLQNDVTRKRPSVDLILNLLCHSLDEKLMARHVVFSSQKIPGLKQTEIDAQIKKDDLVIEASIDFDLPKVTGNLKYRYDNGKHSGKGKANYEGSKLKGSLEIIMSEAAKISGSGMLEMELFKGLRGEAEVAVDEKRNIAVKGKLSVPGQIEIFPEKKYEKSFFNFEKKFPIWGITIPVIDVNVGIFAEIHAGAGFRAKFGPGVLRDIALNGEFGTDPEAATEFGLGGEFFVPAGAEIVANVGGGIGLGLAIADITGGIEALGVAGLYTALTVRPQFKYAGGKYTISGMAELAGVAQLKFGINAFAKIDVGVWLFKGAVWRKDWTLAEWIWNTGLNVALRANISYTLGDDFAPDISFETGQVDPEKFIKDVMPESGSPVPAPPKPPVPDKASFSAEGAQGKQVGGPAGQAPAPPTPGTPPAKTQAGTPEQGLAGEPETGALAVVKESEPSEGEPEIEEVAAPKPAATGTTIHRHPISDSIPEETRIALAASGHRVAGQSDPSEVEASQVEKAFIEGAPLPRITAHPTAASTLSRHPIEHEPDEFPIHWPYPNWGAVKENQVVTREDVTAKRAAFRPMRNQMRTTGAVPPGQHVHHKLPIFLGGENNNWDGKKLSGNFIVLDKDTHNKWHSVLRDQSHVDHETGKEETRNPESREWIGKKFKIYTDARMKAEAKKKLNGSNKR
jgi:hypothetical protein